MNHSNRNRTPADLEEIEAKLHADRPTASALDLDRIKLQAIRQAERSRPSLYATKKGTFMKSRLALTLLLVAGFMFSTTGATLAISGSSGSGSASQSQYDKNQNTKGSHAVKGDESEGKKTLAGTSNGNGPSSGNQGATVEPAPAAVEQQAVVSSSSSLPFTGFVAIPLLIIGLAMIVGGAMIRLKSRKGPLIGS